MKRFFTLLLGALAMVAVALFSAFIAMRLAIHGREVLVPNLAGLTVAEASKLASHEGVALTLENRFYSTDVPAGHILAQDPAAGARVRREWQVRITESLGPQRVSIPDLTGQSERAASVSIRRLTLDLGAVAHLALPGDPGVVAAQTPPSNAGGVDGPRVSLLISDPIAPTDPKSAVDPNALDSTSDSQPTAYVMPSLVGLTYSAASARAAATGLRLLVAVPDAPPVTTAASPSPAQVLGNPTSPVPTPTPQSAPSDTGAPNPTPARTTGIVTAQTPQPGRRVVKGDAVRVTLAHPASADTATP